MEVNSGAGTGSEESQSRKTLRGVLSIVGMLWSVALIVIGVKFDDSCEEVSDVSTDVWLIVSGAATLAPTGVIGIGFIVALLTSCCSAEQKLSLLTKCNWLLMCFSFLSAALLCSVGIFSLIWWGIGIATVSNCYDSLGDTLKVFSLLELVVTGVVLVVSCVFRAWKKKEGSD
eukprot:gb/GECG01005017.1/.p1 GENE.gb/GECG01005017.1/~~gb/GECG01005017.1/.p1  ORF type:complete len:173 (+),score=17.68 gb/GECG01005017.1/:1-519(+)